MTTRLRFVGASIMGTLDPDLSPVMAVCVSSDSGCRSVTTAPGLVGEWYR